MRICPLSNLKNFTITNVSIEEFSVRTDDIFGSQLPAFTNGKRKVIEIEEFVVSDFFVGGVKVSMANDNFMYNETGGLNIASVFLENNGVTII